MQDIIVAQIKRYVAHSFNPFIILPFLIREENAIPPLKFVGCDIFALFHLRAGVDVEHFACALIENVLNERGAIEFLRAKAFEQISFSVVQAHRAVHVRHAKEFIPFGNNVFNRFAFCLFDGEYTGVFCVNIGGLILIIRLVPVA